MRAREGRVSIQQINDLRFKLRRVVGPIAVDLPRAPAERAPGRRAPGMDRVMRLREFIVATHMRGHHHLAGRRLGADYFAFTLKGPNYLDPEVDVHWFIATSRMMVEEAIMAAGSQVLMAAQELPDEIKCRFPRTRDVSNRHLPSHGGD